MDELNGKIIACQLLIAGNQRDPVGFLTDFRDEIRGVVNGVNIAGIERPDQVRLFANPSIDELFSLMKPPSDD